MTLQLENLDDRTRRFMLDEVAHDVAQGKLYISPRLNALGRKEYEGLLRQAIESGDDKSLANALRLHGCFETHEPRQKPKGGTIMARVPVIAPETLAEGEFNRFYARGLCHRALADGISELVICRVKEVSNPRPESEAMIGARINAEALLEDLRTHIGVDTALHVPPGPNSGLSVRLP